MFFKVIVLEKRMCNNLVIIFHIDERRRGSKRKCGSEGEYFLAQENIEKEEVRRTYG